MKNKISLLVLLFGVLACRKNNSTSTTPTPASNFIFVVTDVYGNISNTPSVGGPYVITFSQNGAVVNTVTTASNYFTLNNFKDGAYTYKVIDMHNKYGYIQDSIVSKNGSYYFGRSRNNITTWSSGTALLGYIQAKPTYSLIGCYAKDTVSNWMPGLYVKINTSGTSTSGGLIFYIYKNNHVSGNNLYNYAPLINSNYIVSYANPSFSGILFQSDITNAVPFLQSGDSVYFAVYTSPENPKSIDYLAPKDTTGNMQYTAFGSQKIVVPYKLQ